MVQEVLGGPQEVRHPLHRHRAGGALQVWWTTSLPFDEGNCGVASYCWAMVHDQDLHRLSSGATPS